MIVISINDSWPSTKPYSALCKSFDSLKRGDFRAQIRVFKRSVCAENARDKGDKHEQADGAEDAPPQNPPPDGDSGADDR
jgi:hypothetical protein